jgi:hypothetical protein
VEALDRPERQLDLRGRKTVVWERNWQRKRSCSPRPAAIIVESREINVGRSVRTDCRQTISIR